MPEPIDLSLHIALTVSKGDKTAQQLEIVRNTIYTLGVQDIVNLVTVETNPKNENQNRLIYEVTVDITSSQDSQKALAFLSYLFERMYDSFPAFIEPPL